MKYSNKIFFVFLLGIVLSCSNDELPEDKPDYINATLLLELVNEVRLTGCQCGDEDMPPVNPLVWNNTLAKVAQEHSNYMYKTSTLSHTGENGTENTDRVNNANYEWMSLGENVAKGFADEKSVIEAWLNSPGHCKNIMNELFEEMGVARKENYWTQVFAKPVK
jgi:uncharacterized protein YkwD